MTEKEKLLSGMPYNGGDDELVKERLHAKKLCLEYNSCECGDQKRKTEIINTLFGKVGENPWIEPNFFCDYGYNISVGDNFYINHNCVILDCAKVTFGDYVFIAPNCGFYTAGHPLYYKPRNQGIEYAYPITVGNNVWIGGNVCVMPGVTIGDNVVIGGGSVVVKDIPSGFLAVGNPCRPIRRITEQDIPK